MSICMARCVRPRTHARALVWAIKRAERNTYSFGKSSPSVFCTLRGVWISNELLISCRSLRQTPHWPRLHFPDAWIVFTFANPNSAGQPKNDNRARGWKKRKFNTPTQGYTKSLKWWIPELQFHSFCLSNCVRRQPGIINLHRKMSEEFKDLLENSKK